ncbi:macrolide family glycosyltransferase [Actinokineospora sp.]|uniref:macrolide family glycosyltransferase n=1 Tax=Actinokineospora sp. TaxID=1872133 RepID=UPI004037D751
MSLHIAFFNFPAYGHVNPTLGVIEELTRRGHRVTATATDHLAPSLAAAGAEPVRYNSIFGDYYTSPYTAEANAGEGMRCLQEALALTEQVEGFYRQHRPDVILHDFMAWGGRFVAARNGIPGVRMFPTYGINEHFNIQERFPMAELTDPRIMEMIGKLVEVLPEMGLPGITPPEFFFQIAELGIIYVPRRFHYDGDTFDDRFVFAGPCLGDRSKFQGTWAPSGSGRPVLLISLGTAATGWPEFFTLCLQAFGNTDWDVVMAVGDHVDPAELGELPANFQVSRHVPQLDVLGHASLFVTHGGMNSTMEALYNGVPMVAIPQMNEQRANGLRVEELGLGTHLPRERVTAQSLAAAAASVAADTAVAARVRELRDDMRAVSGPVVAADAIEKFVSTT